MKKLKLLYIFTSGTTTSANNKQWFDLFNKDTQLDITTIIQIGKNQNKEEIQNKNRKINFFFFPAMQEFLQTSYLNKIKTVWDFSRKIKKLKPDVIHIHGCYFTYPLKALILSQTNAKIIFNVWGNDFNTKYFVSKKQKLIMSWLFKKSNLIWANWYTMEEKLKEVFPKHRKKIHTILWGIENDLFSRSRDSEREVIKQKFNLTDEYVILYTKGINKNSQQLELIDVFNELDKKLNYKLIIHCGGTPQKLINEIQERINSFNLQKKIIISDSFLSFNEFKALYDISDLALVLPQKDQLTKTLFEAIISGTNLIISDIPPYIKLLEKFNFDVPLVKVTDKAKVAETLNLFIREKRTVDYSKAVSKIKEKYIFDDKGDKYLMVYKKLTADELIEKDFLESEIN